MKKSLAFLLLLISWATIIAQLVWMIQNKVAPIGETVIRFFSFFTTLTNILVAVYYTSIALIKSENKSFFQKPGVLPLLQFI